MIADTPGGLSHRYVVVDVNGDELLLPLEKVEQIDMSEEGVQAIDDWKYWVSKEYRF